MEHDVSNNEEIVTEALWNADTNDAFIPGGGLYGMNPHQVTNDIMTYCHEVEDMNFAEVLGVVEKWMKKNIFI